MSHAIDQKKAGVTAFEARKTSLQKVGLRVLHFMRYFRGLNKVALIFFPCLFFYGTAFSNTVECPSLQYVLKHVDSNNKVNYRGVLFFTEDNLYQFRNDFVFSGHSPSPECKDYPYERIPTFNNGACVYKGPIWLTDRHGCCCGTLKNQLKLKKGVKKVRKH